jgi:hypothetical protein
MTLVVDQFDQGREGIDVHHAYTPFGWTVFFSKYLSSCDRVNLNALPSRACATCRFLHRARRERGLMPRYADAVCRSKISVLISPVERGNDFYRLLMTARDR